MNMCYEAGRKFMSHNNVVIRLLWRHQGMPLDTIYRNSTDGIDFDVTDLPEEILGAERDKVMAGDRRAHRVVIRRAIDAAHSAVVG